MQLIEAPSLVTETLFVRSRSKLLIQDQEHKNSPLKIKSTIPREKKRVVVLPAKSKVDCWRR
jgi:hypothetical protein